MASRRGAAAGAGTARTPKKRRTQQSNLFQANSIKKLSENEKLKGQSILLDESVYGSDPPEECRGHLYSYLVLEQVPTGTATTKLKVRYKNKRIVINGDEWDSWKEQEEAETLLLTTEQVTAGLKLYMKYLSAVNGKRNDEKEKKLAAVKKELADEASDVSDINAFVEEQGKATGPEILLREFEFTGFVDYESKDGTPSKYSSWKHKYSGETVKRYPSKKGKSYDTGPINDYMRKLAKANNDSKGSIRARYVLFCHVVTYYFITCMNTFIHICLLDGTIISHDPMLLTFMIACILY